MSGGAARIDRLIQAFDAARVIDLARYTSRQIEERPDLAAMPFREAWHIVLNEYAEIATTMYEATERP